MKRKAADFKAGMTLAEVEQFCVESNRVRGEAVRATVNMRGGIKELSVEVTTDD